MTDILYDILRSYLDAGYTDIQGYWNMTLAEITALLEAAVRRINRDKAQQEASAKQQIIMLRNLSLQTGESIACLFDRNRRQLTPLSAYYPGLFGAESSSGGEMSLEKYTVMFEDFAARQNLRRAQRGGATPHE